MKTKRLLHLSALLLTAAIVIGSAAGRKPAPPLVYPFSEAKAITLLPVIDARHDKKASVNLENLRNDAVKRLAHGRYKVSRGAQAEALSGLTADDIKDATPDLIQRLGSAEDRWVLVICINDVSSKVTFGSVGNAEMAGFLFDKQSGKLAWTNKGIGQAGQGGLMGMAMKPAMKGAALSAAMANLLGSIPSQPK